MPSRGKIEFCSTKTVWLLSSNPLLAMAFCFSLAKLAFTNLHLSSCFFWQNSINSDIATFETVAIGKARAASAQSFALWHHATVETMRRNLSYYCLFAPRIYICCSSHTPRSWWITHSTQHYWRGCNSTNFNASTKRWLQAFCFDCMEWSIVMHNEIKCCPGSSKNRYLLLVKQESYI